MREYGAHLEAETDQKARQSHANRQPSHKKTQRKTEIALDPDDEEAMIMAEYSSACAEEIPDEFLSPTMYAMPSKNNTSVATPKTTQKTGWNCRQVLFIVASFQH